MNIPKADFAIIGGSGTLSSNFPLGAKCNDVKIIEDNMVFDTPYGKISCKIAKKGNKIFNISAEYADCKRAAQQYNVPLKKVQQYALFSINEELNHE